MPEGFESKQETIIANPDLFRLKLDKIKSTGYENLHIVADFDRTLTAFRTEATDGRINTTPGILWHVMGEEYVRRASELYAHYRPIETDPTIPNDKKIELMETWTRAWLGNCVELGLSTEKIQQAVDADVLVPRPGFEEFMRIAQEKDVPVLIFSAGVGNIISEYIRRLGVNTPNVHIVSNFAKFDAEGRCIGWNEDVITPMTKNESHTLHRSWAKGITRRSNTLLLGDHPSDIHMADGAKHATVLSIGFLNGDREHLRAHKNVFDVVIVEDVGLDLPIKILKEIEK